MTLFDDNITLTNTSDLALMSDITNACMNWSIKWKHIKVYR